MDNPIHCSLRTESPNMNSQRCNFDAKWKDSITEIRNFFSVEKNRGQKLMTKMGKILKPRCKLYSQTISVNINNSQTINFGAESAARTQAMSANKPSEIKADREGRNAQSAPPRVGGTSDTERLILLLFPKNRRRADGLEQRATRGSEPGADHVLPPVTEKRQFRQNLKFPCKDR